MTWVSLNSSRVLHKIRNRIIKIIRIVLQIIFLLIIKLVQVPILVRQINKISLKIVIKTNIIFRKRQMIIPSDSLSIVQMLCMSYIIWSKVRANLKISIPSERKLERVCTRQCTLASEIPMKTKSILWQLRSLDSTMRSSRWHKRRSMRFSMASATIISSGCMTTFIMSLVTPSTRSWTWLMALSY